MNEIEKNSRIVATVWDKYQYPWPDDWMKTDGIC